jgi:CBS domain containing-hemolysin-like protein
MDPSLSDSVPFFIGLAILVVAAAFLGASEASLLRMSRVRAAVLAEKGDRAAARVLRLIDDLPRTMNAILLLVLLVQVGAATIVGVVAERHFGHTGVTIASVVLTLVMFVYTEAIPKTLAVRNPTRVARFVSIPVTWLARAIRPVVGLLVRFADLQAPGHGVQAGLTINEAELLALAVEAEAAGTIEATDRELIERAFAVGDIRVGEVVVPRIDVVAVSADTPVDAALDRAVATGHRRLPVYGRDLDDIVGVARLRDLAAASGEHPSVAVADLLTPALVVPESRPIIGVLRDMQQQRRSMAVVVDEHGGTVGIATVEDVVEELVGDIADVDTEPMPSIRADGPGCWIVDGTADRREVEATLGAEYPEGDWTTAAGLVIAAAGRIPAAGDLIRMPGFDVEVLVATRRRVRRMRFRATGEDVAAG